jgi:hypothetical protein
MARKTIVFLIKNMMDLINTGVEDEVEPGRSALFKEFDLENSILLIIIIHLAKYFKLPGNDDSCDIKNDPLLMIQLAIEIYKKIPAPNIDSSMLAIAQQMNNRVFFSSDIETNVYKFIIEMGETRIQILPDGKSIVLNGRKYKISIDTLSDFYIEMRNENWLGISKLMEKIIEALQEILITSGNLNYRECAKALSLNSNLPSSLKNAFLAPFAIHCVNDESTIMWLLNNRNFQSNAKDALVHKLIDKDVEEVEEKLKHIELDMEHLKMRLQDQHARIETLEKKDKEREEKEESDNLLMEFFDVALLFGFYKVIPIGTSICGASNWKKIQKYVETKIGEQEEGKITQEELLNALKPLNTCGVDIRDVIDLTSMRSKETKAHDIRSADNQQKFLQKIARLLTDLEKKPSANPTYIKYSKSVKDMVAVLQAVNPKKRFN